MVELSADSEGAIASSGGGREAQGSRSKRKSIPTASSITGRLRERSMQRRDTAEEKPSGRLRLIRRDNSL